MPVRLVGHSLASRSAPQLEKLPPHIGSSVDEVAGGLGSPHAMSGGAVSLWSLCCWDGGSAYEAKGSRGLLLEHVCIRCIPGLFPEAPSVDTWLPEPRIQPSLFVLVSCDCRDKAPQTGLGRGRLQTAETDSQSPEAELKIEVMAGPCSLRAP